MDYVYVNAAGGTNALFTEPLVFLIKFLLVVLVVAVVAGLAVWIKNNITSEYIDKKTDGLKGAAIKTKTKFKESIESDSLLKTIAGITVTVITVFIVIALYNALFRPGFGFSLNILAGTAGITAVLGILIKLFAAVIVVSLTIAAVVIIKKMLTEKKEHCHDDSVTDATV